MRIIGLQVRGCPAGLYENLFDKRSSKKRPVWEVWDLSFAV